MKTQLGNLSSEVITDKSVFEVIRDTVSQGLSEEPFYVLDLADVVYKMKLWQTALPRVRPFYAVKCNNHPVLLEFLASLGMGFDCASKVEIETILNMGVDKSRIIYANPCKTRSFIKHAADNGIALMTFDNEMELYKVKNLHQTARMVLRIRVDDSGAVCQLGMKFGCDVTVAPSLLKLAKELGVNVIGVSFHVGSGSQDVMAFSKAIKLARDVFDMGLELGFEMTLLDIGGGFPGTLVSSMTFEEVYSTINEALDEHFPHDCGVDIIAEPGRYMVASAFTLCVNIIAKRTTTMPAENGESVNMYYLNDGVYGSFNCIIFDHAEVTPDPLLPEDSKRDVCCSSLWGPTCDSMDRILQSCYLPDMNVGEWIVFQNMGAYTLAAASTFNGFEKPSVKVVLPLATWVYLQQLPTWPNLIKNLGLCQAQLDLFVDDQTTSQDVYFLHVAETVSV
ncbi:ornithine decarboxylase-like [Limulus polyphemus]|uniref:ornithine decarboxylase n=1 Tax=Limulus polyphemus TaxID=6850 RepID=A0ABM1B9F7_LIMPO|nr:ornithine decarboxylase-like [Limulus polyphemus]